MRAYMLDDQPLYVCNPQFFSIKRYCYNSHLHPHPEKKEVYLFSLPCIFIFLQRFSRTQKWLYALHLN